MCTVIFLPISLSFYLFSISPAAFHLSPRLSHSLSSFSFSFSLSISLSDCWRSSNESIRNRRPIQCVRLSFFQSPFHSISSPSLPLPSISLPFSLIISLSLSFSLSLFRPLSFSLSDCWRSSNECIHNRRPIQ